MLSTRVTGSRTVGLLPCLPLLELLQGNEDFLPAALILQFFY